MKRYTPIYDEPSSPSELMTAAQLANGLDGIRPHVSTVIRWARRGILVETAEDGPVRVILPSKRCGQKYLFSLAGFMAWLNAQTELQANGASTTGQVRSKRKRKRKKAHAVAPVRTEQPEILTRYGLTSDREDAQ